MKMEAETGAMLSQAREHLEPPEARRRQRCFSLETLEECGPAGPLTLDFWTPEFVREYSSIVLHASLWSFVRAALGNKHVIPAE